MKPKPNPAALETSDFQRWLSARKGWSIEQVHEFCRAGNRAEYVAMFNQWQASKIEPS
jgi:hypothetical protein